MSTSAPDPTDGTGRRLSLLGGRFRGWWLWVALVVALLVAAAWWATHPTPLPRGGTVEAPTPAGAPVYIRVLDAGDRTLELRRVSWDASSLDEDDEVEALVCRDGGIGATARLETFCAEVVPAEGATLRDGDQLVLEVVADEPGTIRIPGVRVAYREGLQWGEQRAGHDVTVDVRGP